MEQGYYTISLPFEAARRDHRGWHGHSFCLRLRSNATAISDHEWLLSEAARVVEPFDYSLLNEQVPDVADPALLSELEQRLRAVGLPLNRLALRSAPDRGAVIDLCDGQRWCWRSFRFEAAHQLPNVPPSHPCHRMHGHGYRVILEAANGEDAEALGQLWQPVAAQLHRSCLKDVLVNPTSERLAEWIWMRLRMYSSGLRRVHVQETEHSGCFFDGFHHTIWKAQRFEAATAHAAARSITGHGYRLRLYLSAPLDPDLGWTLDYADVKAAFAPLRDSLDHHRLDQLHGLAGGDLLSVAKWILNQANAQLPELYRVDVSEDEQRGVIAERDPG
ncbi:6-carboxytetrahydropterin synthase [Halorhodospira halochloris]|uniref:6-pyruvoyl trahydropterin synthase family protein n=1 Tax=Halorhodospira halochloris TaxID=1052 RepID=UPI001EE98F5D|nr:6-carboxytetrahydropterin synthase [Halorhodospira halochloris]MCG5530849.1 6-carboxytetrahydropterin synthase [Halorhodospira halochloris]